MVVFSFAVVIFLDLSMHHRLDGFRDVLLRELFLFSSVMHKGNDVGQFLATQLDLATKFLSCNATMAAAPCHMRAANSKGFMSWSMVAASSIEACSPPTPLIEWQTAQPLAANSDLPRPAFISGTINPSAICSVICIFCTPCRDA
jgi:hypothetical protein